MAKSRLQRARHNGAIYNMTNITRWDLALKRRTARRKQYEKRLAECLQQLAPVMNGFEAQVEAGNIQIVNAAGEHYYNELIGVVHCITLSMGRASSWERKIAEAKRTLEAGSE
jgi:hypothetical protein